VIGYSNYQEAMVFKFTTVLFLAHAANCSFTVTDPVSEREIVLEEDFSLKLTKKQDELSTSYSGDTAFRGTNGKLYKIGLSNVKLADIPGFEMDPTTSVYIQVEGEFLVSGGADGFERNANVSFVQNRLVHNLKCNF
jgi:hypothetical protein